MRLLAASSSGRIDLDTRAFFVSNMVDALGHADHASATGRGVAQAREGGVSASAVLAYLQRNPR